MIYKLSSDQSVLALDVGDTRIGLARAGAIAKLPEPLPAILNNEDTLDRLKTIIDRENIGLIVVGVPRNSRGEETAQSEKIRSFAATLDTLGTEYVFVDESLSSKRADTYLSAYKSSADQDSVAACFILQEFFTTIGMTS